MAGFPGGGPKAKAGLLDRSSRAHECHHALPAPVIERIVRLRRQRLTGAAIARTLGLVRSTVGLALRRLGLGRLSALEPKPAVVRYERAAPGQLIHLDIKKLGRVTRPGRAMKARGPGTHSGGGKGWDYLHGCADDASRLAYTEILPSENQHDVSGFLERALAWLARHGVKTERVMADNGAGYRSRRFAAGGRKAERFIQSSQRVSAYARPHQASEERSRSAIARTGAYNTTRPHAGLVDEIAHLGEIRQKLCAVLLGIGIDREHCGVRRSAVSQPAENLRGALARQSRVHPVGHDAVACRAKHQIGRFEASSEFKRSLRAASISSHEGPGLKAPRSRMCMPSTSSHRYYRRNPPTAASQRTAAYRAGVSIERAGSQ